MRQVGVVVYRRYALYLGPMKKICLFLQMLATIYGAQAQTARYEVYAIRFASAAHPFPISDWADKGPKTDSVSIDFMVWLVKGAGKNILVDAGFLKDIPEGKISRSSIIPGPIRHWQR